MVLWKPTTRVWSQFSSMDLPTSPQSSTMWRGNKCKHCNVLLLLFFFPTAFFFLSHHLYHLRHILLSLLIQLALNCLNKYEILHTLWLTLSMCFLGVFFNKAPAAGVARQCSRDENKQEKDCVICVTMELWALSLLQKSWKSHHNRIHMSAQMKPHIRFIFQFHT